MTIYKTIYMAINVNEAKSRLSYYLHCVEQGETITICKRNIPIAELKPINNPIRKRVLGFAKGDGKITEEFFEPLPDADLRFWTGEK